VEAEPTHIDWCLKHYKQWKIIGDIIPCIISDRNGRCKFAIDEDPSSSYGQSVANTDSPIRTLGNMLRRKAITRTSLKLDTLLSVYKIEKISLVDMDVQGNELRVVRGATKAIEDGRIDYWKIGTHGRKYNNNLSKLLSPYYDLLVDIYPNSIGEVDGLKAKVQDGIQVYKRKGL
jgi:FkbM family methyltransferase